MDEGEDEKIENQRARLDVTEARQEQPREMIRR